MRGVDPIEILNQGPPGTMLYIRFHSGDRDWKTGFFLKEDEETLARLGSNPEVGFSAVTIEAGPVVPVVFIVKIAGNTYESWLNYYQDGGGGPQYFDDLEKQEVLPFMFYGPGGNCRRSIGINNQLAPFIAETRPVVESRDPWGMDAFDDAKASIFEDYSIEDLWEAEGAITLGE